MEGKPQMQLAGIVSPIYQLLTLFIVSKGQFNGEECHIPIMDHCIMLECIIWLMLCLYT